MKYLLCEIRNDDVLVVLKKSITEEEAKESVNGVINTRIEHLY